MLQIVQSIVISYKNNMSRLNSEKVDVLFIGNLQHSQQFASFSQSRKKPQPHTDQIHFHHPVKVHLFRIVKPKRDIYKKYHSITQTQKSIRNFEIFYRNLNQGGSRFSLLSKNGEENLLANLNDDILITSKQGIYTDILVVRGFFTKITVCVYGYILTQEELKEKNHLWNLGDSQKINGKQLKLLEEITDVSAENVKQVVKSELLESIGESVKQGNVHLNLDYVETWYDIHHDDQINENQIRNFTSISQKLEQAHLNLLDSKTASNLVQLRNCLEEFYADLSKIFRNKHLGLYYSTPFRLNQFITFIPSSLPIILLECLNKSQSEQFRALEILRLLLQLESMMRVFVSNQGIEVLQRLYFKLVSSEAFSLIKVLVLEVFLVLAQYPGVAKKFVEEMVEDERIYENLEKKKEKEKEKEPAKDIVKQESKKERSRERSARSSKYRSESKAGKSKKTKKRNRDDSYDSDRRKKKRKDKSSKSRKRDKESKKKRSRSKSSEDDKEKRQKERERDKEREKETETDKQREQTRQLLIRLQSQEEIQKPFTPTKLFTFYQLMICQLKRDTMYKQSMLTKMLIEQILHSVKKTNDLSEQVALYSPLLRETRHLFNPSRQLVNNKTLKTFSTYQPYLNGLQSQGMQDSGLDFIAEIIKVKNPSLYNMDVKAHKIVNIINGKIINSQYDQEFILAMSELILSQKPTTLGINRMISALKSSDIKRSEAVLIMLYEYIYKSMVQDDGFLTLLHIDQVSSAIINISPDERQNYSRDMRIILKFMFNYAIVFDECFSKEFILKALADTFLKSFQYVNIELNKCLDYESIISQPLFDNLKEIYNLGNFNELLPEQPLLVIDSILKVFVVLCKYSKNIWTSYYEYKLTNGFAVLIDKFTKILEFFLAKNIQQEYASSQLQEKHKLIDNYFAVLQKLLLLTLEKTKFESSFNELPEEDTFDEVEAFTNSLTLFDLCLSAYQDKQLKINSPDKIKTILSHIIEIFLYFFQSVELTKIKNKEKKLKKLLDLIYIRHSNGLRFRPQMLTLYGCLVQCTRDRTKELAVNYFLQKYQSSNELSGTQEILVPNNEKSVLENILRLNVLRSQGYLRNSLVYLFTTFLEFNNYHTTSFIYKMIESYLKEMTDELRLSSRKETQEVLDTLLLNKLILVLSFVERIMVPSFKNMLVHAGLVIHINKLLKTIVDQLIIKQNPREYKIVLLQLRNTIVKLLVKVFNPEHSMSKETTSLGFDIPNIQDHQSAFKLVNFSLKLPDPSEDETIIQLQLEGVRQSMDLCLQGSKTLSSQTIILYGQYVENAFKPDSLVEVTIIIESKLNAYEDTLANQKHREIYRDIYSKTMFFLVNLTQISSKGVYNCETRKTALKHLIGESVFPRLSQLSPNPYLIYLLSYFSSPSLQIRIERQIQKIKELSELFRDQKQKEQKVGEVTSLFNNFSEAVLDVIFEKQDIAKTRYKCVVGEWIGGNISEPYTPLRTINTKKLVENMLAAILQVSEVYAPKYPLVKQRANVEYNELLTLYTKKQYVERVKRAGTASISFKQIPLEIKAPIIEEPMISHKPMIGAPQPPINSMPSMPYSKPQATAPPTYVPPPPSVPSTSTYQPSGYTPPPVPSTTPAPYTPQTTTYTRQQQYTSQHQDRSMNSERGSSRGHERGQSSNYYYQQQNPQHHSQQQHHQSQHHRQQPQHDYRSYDHQSYGHSHGSSHQYGSYGGHSQSYHPQSHTSHSGHSGHSGHSSHPSHSQYNQYSHTSSRGHHYPPSGPVSHSGAHQYQQPTFQTVSDLVQKLTRSRDQLQKTRLSQELEQILNQYPHLKVELSKRLNEIKEGN